MTASHVAFVRNVMIGREGLHRVRLLGLFEQAGATTPVSYISTGNVSFELDAAAVPAAVEQIEGGIAEIIGRHEPVFVRTVGELRALRSTNPFDASPYPDPHERTVTFFREAVPANLALPIIGPRGELEVFFGTRRELFSVNRLIDDRTRAPGGLIEKATGERVTSRSWNTIDRILTKLDDAAL